MIGHYFETALWTFRKTPFTTAANIIALALGLACFMAALGISTYWRSADHYHAAADRTFVLGQGFTPTGGKGAIPVGSASSAAPAKYLPQDFPQIEAVTRIFPQSNRAVVTDSRKALLDGAFADANYLSFFDFDFIAGDPKSALDQPGNVILTKATAERLFGAESAMGKSMTIAGRPATVTGVINPVRQPSFMGDRPDSLLEFDFLGNWRLSAYSEEIDAEEEWFGVQGMTILRLKPGASVEALNAGLQAFIDRRMPKSQRDVTIIELEAFPVSEVSTRNLDNLMFGSHGMDLKVATVLLALGALILLAAGVNYANLSTAQAAQAGKQIGLRKVLGAGRAEIMAQSWLTSLLQTMVAMALALAALAFAAPLVKTAMGIDPLYILAGGPGALALIAGMVLLTALAAGAYPALVLSRVRPAQALQSGRSRTGPKFVSRLLVGVQFATASFLLILLIASHMQRSYLEKIALDAQQDPVVVLNEVQGLGIDGEAFVKAVENLPGVKEATVSERAPWMQSVSFLPLIRTPEAGATEYTSSLKHVGHDYFQTLDVNLLAGRYFDREHETVTRSITTPDPALPIPTIFDEKLAKAMGFDSAEAAVGKTVYVTPSVMRIAGGDAAQPLQIIGVTETDTSMLGASNAHGTFYFFGPTSPFGNGLRPILRLAPGDVDGTIKRISAVWDQFAPANPIDVRFVDQLFELSYRQYGRTAQLFNLLANVAVVIAGLGLLGIAVHVAARRRHEIAVRKTLGSTTGEAVLLLLSDFSKPVIIANLIAWPLGYLASEAYLSAFASRIDLSPWPFVLSLLGTLALAWIVVAGQTINAARVSPAQALRDQ